MKKPELMKSLNPDTIASFKRCPAYGTHGSPNFKLFQAHTVEPGGLGDTVYAFHFSCKERALELHERHDRYEDEEAALARILP